MVATATACKINFRHMTTLELCESAGVSEYQCRLWLETGLLEAKMGGIPGGGHRLVFTLDQLQRARLLKLLRSKGVSLARLATTDLTFGGARYIVDDGARLRACPDAGTAVDAIVRTKGRCAVVDLGAVRQA
jgi:hypothetical protein